jgi:cell division protein FtsB
MNIQARSLKLNRSRKKNNTRQELGAKLGFVFTIILVMGAFFLIANYRISLNQNVAALDRESDKIVQQIAQLDREIENLRVKKEKLSSWPHIKDRIQKFNLALRMPEPFQVQSLKINYDSTGKDNNSGERKTAMLSER